MARLRWLSRQERLVLGGLVGAIVLLSILLVRQWLAPPPPALVWSTPVEAGAPVLSSDGPTGAGSGGVAASGSSGAEAVGQAAATGSPGKTLAPVVVHVAGAVEQPGVFSLATGDRVVDAISAAGGAADDARLDWLNLAEPLYDGQKVYVPAEADPGPPDPYAGPGGSQGGAAGVPALVDLNRASQSELESLPGIGPTLAREIMTYREKTPFQGVDDLMNVSGIGPKTLERIRPYVVVR